MLQFFYPFRKIKKLYSLKYFRVSWACSVVKSRSPKYIFPSARAKYEFKSSNSASVTSPVALSTPLSASRLSEFDSVSSAKSVSIFSLSEFISLVLLSLAVYESLVSHSSEFPQLDSPCSINEERLMTSRPASFPVLQWM